MNAPLPHFETLPYYPSESHWLLIDASVLDPRGRMMVRIQNPDYAYLPESLSDAHTGRPGAFSQFSKEQEIAAVEFIREEDLL